MKLHRIEQVRHEGEYKLRLRFEDGAAGLIDLKPVAREGGVYAPLSDADFFRQFRVERHGRVLAWPEGIEFCADALWKSVADGTGLDMTALPAMLNDS